ncbi:hypothetical protein WA158_003560 [Blastocystis sp. Blastoise]
MNAQKSESDKYYNIFHVRQTVYKMLNKRGYAVDPDDINLPLDQFIANYTYSGMVDREKMTIYVGSKKNPESNKLLVKFIASSNTEKNTISTGEIKGIQEKACGPQLGLSRIIFIFASAISSQAKQALEVRTNNIIIEYFYESELIIDITEHELVPEHTVLTPEEKATLLKQYGLSDSQLPRLMKKDPIARYFGLQKGDVVRITRRSETAGKYVTYRIVDI